MTKNIKFGIVQGRLTQSPIGCLQWFPRGVWHKEFKIASEIGIHYIELISEIQHNIDNPIWSQNGIEKIKQLTKDNNLMIYALCNDFIVKHHFLLEEVIEQNIKLLNQGQKLGVKKYILPFFESSELNSENMTDYVEPIKRIAKFASDRNILICLETILTGQELIEFLDLINMMNVKVVYDTGNRVAFGHDLSNDIQLLNEKIVHVHIKDKNKENENVLLGTGLVNFESVFNAFKAINYVGPYTFETTRGNNPIKTAIYNMNLVSFFESNSQNA